MSWREREFRHESDAYYRSLDQTDPGGHQEACAGYHLEDGETVCDWFKCQGTRVNLCYLGRQATHVYVGIEGISHPYRLRIPRNGMLITAARKLAEKVLYGIRGKG